MKGLGGSGGSLRVLKHPGVSASIMLDPPNRLQKKLGKGSNEISFWQKNFRIQVSDG